MLSPQSAEANEQLFSQAIIFETIEDDGVRECLHTFPQIRSVFAEQHCVVNYSS